MTFPQSVPIEQVNLTYSRNILECTWLSLFNNPLGIQMAPEHMMSAGLHIGQRHKLFVPGTKGSGWYNECGQWFGWGDLTRENMANIAKALGAHELVIVLHEEEAFRRFLRNVLPDNARGAPSEDAPGMEYVMKHALFVIAKNRVCRIHDTHPMKHPDVTGGISYEIVAHDTARAIMLAHFPAEQVVLA